MAKKTFYFSLIFIFMGVFGYYASGAISATAFIPSIFGLIYALFAFLMHKFPQKIKAWIISSIVLSLLAMSGTFRGFKAFLTWLTGQAEIERLMAVQIQGIFFLLSLTFLIIAFKSLGKNPNQKELTT